MPGTPNTPSGTMRRLLRRLLGGADHRAAEDAPAPRAPAPVFVDRGSRRLAHEVGRAFAERLQLAELIPFAVARCREVLDAEGVAVLLYDRTTDELYFPYVAAEDPAVAARMMRIRFPADRGIAGAVLRSRTPVRVDDAMADPRFFAGVDQQMAQTTRALLCVPLISPAGVIGVIEAVNLRGAALFTDDDLALFEALAQSLAAAIHNARSSGPPAVGGGQESPLPPRPQDEARPEPGRTDQGAVEPAAAATFRREGEYWTIEFAGTVSRLKDTKGLHYIAHLLRHPGQEFHVRELVAGVGDALSTSDGAGEAPAVELDAATAASEHLTVSGLGDAGPVLDAKAKADYKRRLDELREELEEAERFNDPGRADRAREEIEFISDQLAGAVGLGGRDRVAASDAERARIAVTKRIKAALGKIRQANPALGSHLADALTTGYFCSYAPKADHPPTAWSL
jgi:GAF domain-containing protein